MAKPLTITVVSQRVPFPPNKGEKLRTYHQIKFLTELGHNVEVLSLGENEQDEKDARALSEKLAIPVTVFTLGRKAVRYLWALLNNEAISVGAFYNKALQAVLDEKLLAGCDVLLLSASSLGYYVFNSPSYSGHSCALLMDMMDVDSDKWRQYAASSSWPMSIVYKRESKKISALEAQANKEFDDTFLIASEETRLFKQNVCAQNLVKVLGNGLDFSAFYPAKHASDATNVNYLFTGVMDYKPNVDAVLWFVEKCWPSIKHELPSATFTVGGMNPTKEIQALAAQHDDIVVTGFVDDILPYFHDATAFVAPFRLARGVQNKVLQAAACKLPVVTTSMGAEGISYAGSETMWIADDADAFSKACIACVKEIDTASARALKAFNALHFTYSWEQQLQPLKASLEAL